MTDLFPAVSALYKNRINLLLVDDDYCILESMARIFNSPLFNFTTADSYERATALLKKNDLHWHTWILDVDLGRNMTGIDIMKTNQNFPFIIILSGLQSMHTAAQAVELGALGVFDKDPDEIDNLYSMVCKICALGFILGGKPTQYLKVFKLLTTGVITTVEEWAYNACLTRRQLQRICELHPGSLPRSTICLYYSLYILLWKGLPPYSDVLPPEFSKTDSSFVAECMDYCLKNPARGSCTGSIHPG